MPSAPLPEPRQRHGCRKALLADMPPGHLLLCRNWHEAECWRQLIARSGRHCEFKQIFRYCRDRPYLVTLRD